jgi:DNA mismatch repair protein MutS
MQVGSFHECYCNETEGLNLVELAEKLDVVCTKKNSKEPLSKKNPRMMGFPIHVTDNFIEKLCNINYTVIKIDQTSEPPKPKREVVGIFSPGTLINSSTTSNYIISIVIDKIKTNNLCIGLASYDLSTGYGSYFETYSNNDDLMLVLDDAMRYIETCPPKEIIVHNNLNDDEKFNNLTIDNIFGYLNIDKKILFSYNNIKNTNKLTYQKIIFEKIFPNEKNIFEILNLHLYNWARFALTNLYDYLENHQFQLINKLKQPVEFKNNKFLYLGNHSLDQLNVFNKNPNEKSLFQIINNTKTLLGKRFLSDALTKPLIDKELIETRYNSIENIINNKLYDPLSSLLEDIADIQRLVRRLELGTMHPYELYTLYLSLYQINKLTLYCKDNNIFDIDLNYDVTNILDYINETFNLEQITSLNFTNFTEYEYTIFKINKYKEIDNLLEEINSSTHFMDNLIEKLSSYVGDKKCFVKKNEENNSTIQLKFNERDKHYLLLTNRRCELLKKNLKNVETIMIGKYILNVSDLEFIELPRSSYTKINCVKIKEISNELVVQKIKMAKYLKEKFKLELNTIANKFNEILNYWGEKVGFIDFINSGAITTIKNHYCKPIVEINKESFFNGTNLRHPIVEYISKDYEYKTHSLALGGSNELSGILLYGINSSGKSTLMKSIGLNIILAQIGYYVAAQGFIYTPYHSLFTRISGNDNIYRGLSSFMVELTELSSILKRNNCNTLVIADEVCRGSENTSSTIIVAYMLKTLCESKTSFITASHLHELVNLPTVKNLSNLQIKHIKLTYDDASDQLIYDRVLSNGSGSNFYGLQVAKYLMKNNTFNESTDEILKEYNGHVIKKSKYNSENYLVECEICKSKNNLETHHIVEQRLFDNEVIINKDNLHIQKDANYNLVTLCRQCHDDVDRNKIIIYGWEETSNGRQLNYKFDEPIAKQSKYNDELIYYIKSLKKENVDLKFARIKIKEKFNKKISSKSISLLWG